MTTPETALLTPEEIAEIEASLAEVPPGPYPPEWESCDCSDGICSHGSWRDALTFPIPKEGTTIYRHRYDEIREFPGAVVEMFANAEPNLRRLVATTRYYQALSQTFSAKLAGVYPDLSGILGTHDKMVQSLRGRVKALETELAAKEQEREDLYFRLEGQRFEAEILHARLSWALHEAGGKEAASLIGRTLELMGLLPQPVAAIDSPRSVQP